LLDPDAQRLHLFRLGGGFGAFFLKGAAQRLAVDGDQIRRRAGHCRHPSHEAALEGRGVERGKNIAEVVVGRRSVAKRPEPAQKVDLLLAEPGDIDERLRSAQHRQQTQQQHLGERIDNLAGLARVGQILEVIEKNNGFAQRRKFSGNRLHRILRKTNQRITTDSAHQPFVTNFFTRLPWEKRPVLLHDPQYLSSTEGH